MVRQQQKKKTEIFAAYGNAFKITTESENCCRIEYPTSLSLSLKSQQLLYVCQAYNMLHIKICTRKKVIWIS